MLAVCVLPGEARMQLAMRAQGCAGKAVVRAGATCVVEQRASDARRSGAPLPMITVPTPRGENTTGWRENTTACTSRVSARCCAPTRARGSSRCS